jgi:hypothetical protein
MSLHVVEFNTKVFYSKAASALDKTSKLLPNRLTLRALGLALTRTGLAPDTTDAQLEEEEDDDDDDATGGAERSGADGPAVVRGNDSCSVPKCVGSQSSNIVTSKRACDRI